MNGREFVFAHNGTLKLPISFYGRRCQPVGGTDSEGAFCHILNQLWERGDSLKSPEDFDWLASVMDDLNRSGSFNCLMSDGRRLFVYRDSKAYNSLQFISRKFPFSSVKLKDEDFEMDLSANKKSDEKGFIIATRALTDEPWEDFLPGELAVFRDGEMIYSNLRSVL